MSKNETPKKALPYANKGDLTNGSIKNHLIRLTIPMIWGLFAVIAVQLADTYFISLMDDTDILAGISLTFPVTMIISHIVFGINIAMSSNVSRLLGANKRDEAKVIVLHGILMAFAASSVIAIGTYLSLEPIFKLLGADETTLPTIQQYMPVWLIASAILAIPVNSNSAVRASGNTFTPAMVMTCIALVNFILDPLLIFGLFGFPELGVKGAAIATLIAYCCGLVFALYIMLTKEKLIAVDGLHLDKFKASLKKLGVIAIPAGIANIIGPGTNAVVMAMLAKYGNEAVAAMGIVSRIEAFSLILVLALATGMAPIIGQNWGAEKFDRVHRTINLAIIFNLIWSLCVAIILGMSALQIAGAFSDDPAVIYYAKLYFWIVPISFAFGNLVFGWSSAFNAMGLPKKAFMMIFVKSIIITVPAVLLGAKFGGVIGIFIALMAANFISGGLFHYLSRRDCQKAEEKRQAAHAK